MIDSKIGGEKLEYSINREASKITVLSSGKIDKYEHLIGKEMLPSDQSIMIKQATFTYSPLGKSLEKQTKTIENQERKQTEAIKDLKPEN